MARKFTGNKHIGQRRVRRPNGDIYVYERVTQYDQQTRKTRTIKSTLLGILDPKTDEIVPTRKKSPKKEIVAARREHTGMTDILAWAGRETGISSDLEKSFGISRAQKIDTAARYLVATDGAPMPRIEAWQISHPTPYAPGLSEDVYCDLFHDVGINEDGQQKYFAERAATLKTSPSIAFDSTTISTYSRHQIEARQGFNKDHDGLDTIKLLTLYSVSDMQPIAFCKQPGNVPDVISIKNTLKQLRCFCIDKPLVVTDNGYCSQQNMAEFARSNMKFLTLIQTSVSWVRSTIDELRETIGKLSSVCDSDHTVSAATQTRMHTFSIVRQRSRGSYAAGESESFDRRIYVHVFFSRDRVAKDEQHLIEDLHELRGLVEEGATLSDAGQKKADKFLICSRAGRGGKLKVAFNDEAFDQAKKYFGFFVLVSNEVKQADEALRLYRRREKIEDLFNVQKNSLDGRRPRTWYPDNLKGRLFCQFVALGYHCFLMKRIGEVQEQLERDTEGKTQEELQLEKNLKRWIKEHSLIQILEWFDCVETTTVQTPRGKIRWSTESIKRDQLFLKLLGVTR